MRKALFLLGILEDGDLDWMIAAGAKREVASGSTLIAEGHAVEDVFVLLDGVLAVRTARGGAGDIAQLHAGEIVGEMSFVDARPPSASVVALAPAVVLAIPRAALARKLLDDIPFAARFYRSLAVFLSDRLRSTVGRLGYGRADDEEEEEMAPDTLDNLALAGARFDWLQRRLKEL